MAAMFPFLNFQALVSIIVKMLHFCVFRRTSAEIIDRVLIGVFCNRFAIDGYVADKGNTSCGALTVVISAAYLLEYTEPFSLINKKEYCLVHKMRLLHFHPAVKVMNTTFLLLTFRSATILLDIKSCQSRLHGPEPKMKRW